MSKLLFFCFAILLFSFSCKTNEVAEPSNVRWYIDKIQVISIPPKMPDGKSWDTLATGENKINAAPDLVMVYNTVNDTDGIIKIGNNVTQESLPYTAALPANKYELADAEWSFKLFDDELAGDQYKWTLMKEFKASNPALKGSQKYIVVSDEEYKYYFAIYINEVY